MGGLRDRLAVMVEHLHHGADAYGQQESDDQGGHSATQRGLGRQQASISGVGDGLRQPLIESARADALAASARAMILSLIG